MIKRICVELETPGDSRTMFRLLINDNAVGEGLTAVQAHILIGEVFDRVTLPRSGRRAAVEHAAREKLATA
jgi:hypothetical protein